MIVRIDKAFERDTKKVKDKKLRKRVAETIEQVRESSSRDEIKNLKKLRGSQHYYRIRIGDYRIGISIEEDTVDFIRFLPRKDIYKFFP